MAFGTVTVGVEMSRRVDELGIGGDGPGVPVQVPDLGPVSSSVFGLGPRPGKIELVERLIEFDPNCGCCCF